jgi:hypothetical protein
MVGLTARSYRRFPPRFSQPLYPAVRHCDEMLAPLLDFSRNRCSPGQSTSRVDLQMRGVEGVVHATRASQSLPAISFMTCPHIAVPRGSWNRSGWRTRITSVRSSKPSSTMRDASVMAERMVAMSSSRRSNGAQINTTSCTGAQISILGQGGAQHVVGGLRDDPVKGEHSRSRFGGGATVSGSASHRFLRSVR